MTETTNHFTDIQLRKMLLAWHPASQTALLINEILALREEVARLRAVVPVEVAPETIRPPVNLEEAEREIDRAVERLSKQAMIRN